MKRWVMMKRKLKKYLINFTFKISLLYHFIKKLLVFCNKNDTIKV